VALRTELDGLDKTSERYSSILSDINKIQIDLNNTKEDERKGKMSYREGIMNDLLGKGSVSMADKLSMIGKRREELQGELGKASGSERYGILDQLRALSMQAAQVRDKGEGGKKQYAGAMLYGSAEAYSAELAGGTTAAKLEQNTGNMVRLMTNQNRLVEQELALMKGDGTPESLGDFLYGP
jgi:hypothetical protein